jgi:hypothetical protein
MPMAESAVAVKWGRRKYVRILLIQVKYGYELTLRVLYHFLGGGGE